MAEFSFTYTIRLAWWVLPYLCTLQVFGYLTGLEPDTEKAANLVARHGTTVGLLSIKRTED